MAFGTDPEPIPCANCGTPIFPNQDYCSEECERAVVEGRATT